MLLKCIVARTGTYPMGEKMKAFWQGRKKWQKWTIVIVGIGLLGGFLSLFDPEILLKDQARLPQPPAQPQRPRRNLNQPQKPQRPRRNRPSQGDRKKPQRPLLCTRSSAPQRPHRNRRCFTRIAQQPGPQAQPLSTGASQDTAASLTLTVTGSPAINKTLFGGSGGGAPKKTWHLCRVFG